MTGRVYLDWNATAPLRPEARAAMLAAMDAVGNPSSVHAEGRAAWAIVERARMQVARLAGCDPDGVIFTSGATEANRMALGGGAGDVFWAATEHDSVAAVAERCAARHEALAVDRDGRIRADHPLFAGGLDAGGPAGERRLALAPACGETGVTQDVAPLYARARAARAAAHADATQAIGRVGFDFAASGAATAALSAHKLGGPKGVGALLTGGAPGAAPAPLLVGGGQERGRRAGTPNVIGVAGFGAAAEAALRDLDQGLWSRVERLRNILEDRLAASAPDAIIVGAGVARLPNTTCVVVPGWRGETQVMQLDLAGFAVSAGAACSSGKAAPSRALRAMGHDDVAAASAIRVSLGPTTAEQDVLRFADAWTALYARRRRVAA